MWSGKRTRWIWISRLFQEEGGVGTPKYIEKGLLIQRQKIESRTELYDAMTLAQVLDIIDYLRGDEARKSIKIKSEARTSRLEFIWPKPPFSTLRCVQRPPRMTRISGEDLRP